MRCLLIETKDRRRFLTYENYLPLLGEFSRTFNAKLTVVEADEDDLLEMDALAPAMCDPEYKKKNISYETVGVLKSRSKTLESAGVIRNHIRSRFETGLVVSLSELRQTFGNLGLTTACLCNHVRKVMAEMGVAGRKFEKVGGGKYRLK